MLEPTAISPIITVTDAWRLYGTLRQERALAGLTLSLAQGEFVCLAGPSGSGKTTLLNLIGLLDLPDRGRVRVMGQETGGMTLTQRALFRRAHLGFIFQAYNLIPVLSVAENVEYPLILAAKAPKERAELVETALELVGIADHGHKRPGELSGGQQQRAAVARAIAGSPPIILADEPTGSLDSVTGGALLELMLRLNEQLGTTFVFSSHDPTVINQARRIVTLRDGQVVEDRQRGRSTATAAPSIHGKILDLTRDKGYIVDPELR